jgi:citrate lyase subunit beta / citryl-CoA lyase
MPVQPFRSVASLDRRPVRLRRSVLAVPGSSEKMLTKAAGTAADAVFLDLEDAVAPDQKKAARDTIVGALRDVDYGDKTVVVRVNDATTPFQYGDIIEVVRGGHAQLDCLMLPKVEHAGELWFVDTLLGQLELDLGLEQRIGLEVQIESGAGAVALRDIATVTDRIETLIFGPGDYAANQGIPQLTIGGIDPDYPGHQWHFILASLVNTARAVGIDAIDGPYSDYSDPDGLRETATRAKLLGLDGKWCIHPSQIEVVNEVFTPTQEQFDHARAVIDAYDAAIAEGKGAATLDGMMIDEASRKMALKLVGRGEAAGLG